MAASVQVLDVEQHRRLATHHTLTPTAIGASCWRGPRGEGPQAVNAPKARRGIQDVNLPLLRLRADRDASFPCPCCRGCAIAGSFHHPVHRGPTTDVEGPILLHLELPPKSDIILHLLHTSKQIRAISVARQRSAFASSCRIVLNLIPSLHHPSSGASSIHPIYSPRLAL